MFVVINKVTGLRGGLLLGHVSSRHRTAANAYVAERKMQPDNPCYIPTLVAKEKVGLSVGEYVEEGDIIRLSEEESREAYDEACAILDKNN